MNPLQARSLFVVLLPLLAAAGAVALSGCKEAEADKPLAYPYRIVTTVGMVGDIVRQIAGDKAVVEGIIGEGIDPHLYKPTRNDIAAMMKADVLMYSGLMLEGKLADTLVNLARSGKAVYAVTELIDEKYLLEPAEMQGHHDPHVWMDVAAWSKGVEAVAGRLAEFDPSNADYYKANAAAYNKQLAEMDSYVKGIAATVPEKSRVLITAHDAFNYFGRAYGFEVRGIQGLSTESEAGLKDIQGLVDLIVERDVRAVFVETSVSEKNVQALVEGARNRGKSIRVGGTLYSDAMGAAGTYEGTYLGMIDHNATTIVRALGGEAPERGLHGKLSIKN